MVFIEEYPSFVLLNRIIASGFFSAVFFILGGKYVCFCCCYCGQQQLVVSFCCSCKQPCSSDYFVNCSDTKASVSNAKPDSDSEYPPTDYLERLFRCCLCYLGAKENGSDEGGGGGSFGGTAYKAGLSSCGLWRALWGHSIDSDSREWQRVFATTSKCSTRMIQSPVMDSYICIYAYIHRYKNMYNLLSWLEDKRIMQMMVTPEKDSRI